VRHPRHLAENHPQVLIIAREQSSVRKQLNALNDLAQRLIGGSLVVKQGRGQALLFTPTGQAVAHLAATILETWSNEIQATRRRVGTTITVGSTEFTIRFLGEVWPAVRDAFERTGVELKIVHVRTRDFWARLDAKTVDLICGSFATERGQQPTLDYDFIEWHREPVALLTNLSTRELSDRPSATPNCPASPCLLRLPDCSPSFYAAGTGRSTAPRSASSPTSTPSPTASTC
jgi:hypothetical protein